MCNLCATTGDDTQIRLEQLERRHERLQDVLANAAATYEALIEMPNASERQVQQAQQRIRQTQKELATLQSNIELLEEQAALA